jgi:hypothetical protein
MKPSFTFRNKSQALAMNEIYTVVQNATRYTKHGHDARQWHLFTAAGNSIGA